MDDVVAEVLVGLINTGTRDGKPVGDAGPVGEAGPEQACW